ncbi:hypothetical protein [Casimicrobium huifangae]|uniref:hypothetical protein n=1 Tax=Casimicrobium huifangae TaxID=2591109 RepID=UPI003782FD5D
MNDIGVIIMLAVFIIAIARIGMRVGSTPRELHPSSPSARLPGDGSFAFEIVGEASYQRALRKIAGEGKVRHECTAIIYLEDENPHDNKAVRVDIDGHTVGYFSRADARRYRKQIAKHGPITSECDALILGGGKGKPSLGVWLDLPTSG